MRKRIVIEYVSLDGVIQGPGHAGEDTAGGFDAGRGTSRLIQTLGGAWPVDAYQLWLHPVVLGGGKRLFADDSEISKVRREAASYRRKLRVEAERDKLAARLGDVQRAEVERFGEALKGRRAKGWPLAPRRIGGDCVGDVTVGPAGSE